MLFVYVDATTFWPERSILLPPSVGGPVAFSEAVKRGFYWVARYGVRPVFDHAVRAIPPPSVKTVEGYQGPRGQGPGKLVSVWQTMPEGGGDRSAEPAT